MKKLLENSRYIVLLGVLGSFMMAVALFLFGIFGAATSIIDAVTTDHKVAIDGLKQISTAGIQVIDTFLLATVFYIISMGLYELFIDESLDLPNWLEVKTLDDLKGSLLGVIIVVLPVTFLGKLVDVKAGIDILWLGLSVAVVLVAIAATQVAKKKH